jgi:hypothetical protein
MPRPGAEAKHACRNVTQFRHLMMASVLMLLSSGTHNNLDRSFSREKTGRE